MALRLGKINIDINASHAQVVCDACRTARRKCSREAPACARCRLLGLACTRQGRQGLECNYMFRFTRQLRNKQTVPLTWNQAIEAHSNQWWVQFCMRRYLMPLVLLLPKPTVDSGFKGLRARALQITSFKDHVEPLSVQHPMDNDIFREAVKTFFRVINAFYPLFSEESFHAKPRSKTLVKIVVHLGLERMPQTVSIQAAIAANGLTTRDFEQLPVSLDTLQCHLLVHLGIGMPRSKEVHVRLVRYTRTLFSLLGLHVNPPSAPQWLERTLAVCMYNYAYHRASFGQAMVLTKFHWADPGAEHLKPGFMRRRAAHFKNTCEIIHVIASLTASHCVIILADATRDHARALQRRTRADVFANSLRRHLRKLEANFQWGWALLARLTKTVHRELLVKARVTMALRYHDDYIHLVKLGLYIPKIMSDPLLPSPTIATISEFSRMGLIMAARNIRLAATINPLFPNQDYIRNFITPLAFVMLHVKVVEAEYGQAEPLGQVLALARACLQRGLDLPLHRPYATGYLEIFDFLIKRNKITLVN